MSEKPATATPEFAYTFTGKVYPERAPIQLVRLHQELHVKEAGLEGKLDVWIQVSQVTVTFSSDIEVKDLATLKNMAEDIARLAVDIEGYRRGGGYDLEMIQVIPGSGDPRVFGCGIDALEQRPSKPDYADFVAALNAPGGDALRIALADFREGIRVPKDTGFFCYRAAESLRQIFQKDDSDREKREAWDRMKQVLNIPQDDLMFLKNAADAVRHGKSPFISGADRVRALLIASTIIDKAIDYLKGLRAADAAREQTASPSPMSAPPAAEAKGEKE